MTKSGRKILITGGAGFIGTNAVSHFLQKGWEVTIFDNFSRRGTDLNLAFLEKAFPKKVKVIRGDVTSESDVAKAMRDAYDVVLHLAGQVAVTTSVERPREDFAVNALGTFNLLEAVRLSSRPPIFLYASTNKVYGGLETMKVEERENDYVFSDMQEGVSEDAPLDFHSPYGCSKGAADQYVRDYARIYGLRTVVFRQSCIYGPHQMGIEDQGWVAWFMIASLLGKPITLYGNGKQVRDVLFIDDLTEVYSAAITHIDRTAGQIYNIGGGPENSLSLLTFLEHLKNNLGLSLSPSHAPVRPGDQPIFVSNNARAKRDFGWAPKVRTQEGFAHLFQWLSDNMSLFHGLYR